MGGRANTPALGGMPALGAVVQSAASSEAAATLLDQGGQTAAHGQYGLVLRSQDDSARAREAPRNAGSLAQGVMQVAAASPEANPLEALNRAAEAFRPAGGGAAGGTIVLVDPSLQTTGPLDYTQEGMLAAEPQDVVKAQSTAGQLPDPAGMTLHLVGVGQAVAPQQPLDGGSRHDVQSHWKALVEEPGASCVAFDDTPRAAPPYGNPPKVSTFPIPEVTNEVPTPSTPRILRDEVRFSSDGAEYVNPQMAHDALRPIADWERRSGASITLTGTTASDGAAEGRKRLSLLRAGSVKVSLVGLGAAGARTAASGVGNEHSGHVPDVGPNGELPPGLAAQNLWSS